MKGDQKNHFIHLQNYANLFRPCHLRDKQVFLPSYTQCIRVPIPYICFFFYYFLNFNIYKIVWEKSLNYKIQPLHFILSPYTGMYFMPISIFTSVIGNPLVVQLTKKKLPIILFQYMVNNWKDTENKEKKSPCLTMTPCKRN